MERAAARVCRETGGRVTTNTPFTELIIPAPHRLDQRRIEVIANGLPLYEGAQLAVNATLFSPLTTASQPLRRQGNVAGAGLLDARRAKERVYPELLQAQLVVLGIEVGGRFSQESARFLRLLAAVKTRFAPPLLRPSAASAFISRFSALLAAAAFRSFAAVLLEETAVHSNVDAGPPLLSDIVWQTPQHQRSPTWLAP